MDPAMDPLAPAGLPRGRALRDAAITIAVAATTVACGAYVADLCLPMLELWRVGLAPAAPWPGDAAVLGIHRLAAWLVGGVVPGIAVAVVLTSRFLGARWVRVVAVAVGLACVTLAVATVAFRPTDAAGTPLAWPWANFPGLGAGVAAAVHLAIRRRVVRPARRRERAIIVLAVVVAAVGLGVPTLVETHAEYRSQALRPFTIELAAAYPVVDGAQLAPGELPAAVVDAHGARGERVEHAGRRFDVHRGDRVTITRAQVERVRWFEADEADDGVGISLRLDATAAAAMLARSQQRMSQHDALYVDGALISVPRYDDVVVDRLWLRDRDRDAQRRLYDLLAAE